MKRIVFISISLIIAQYSFAALPPRYQNIKDLDVMVDYIKKHPEVASGLQSIELLKYTIQYGNGCQAVFGRKSIIKPPGWVGPADPLEFKKSSCTEE